MTKKKTHRRGRVFVVAYNADRNVVAKVELPIDEFYDELHPLIDEQEFRFKQGIRMLTGEIYDLDGTLSQSFENFYDDQGRFVSGRSVHEDGTVTER